MRKMRFSEIGTVNSIVNKTLEKMHGIYASEKFRIKMENNLVMLFLRKLIGEKIMVNDELTATIAYNGNLMGNLFVLPSEQGKGIGNMMIDETEKIIGKKYNYAKFYSYRNAVPFHKKRGYEIKDKSNRSEGLNFLSLALRGRKN